MVVRSLHLSNFRNYASQNLTLPPGLVALTGDNGQGKTNLLEALCVLSTTKSPLIERDRELIRWNQSEARLEAEIELSSRASSGREGERRHLFYNWRVEGAGVAREMRVGGVPQSAIAQWLGQLQVVGFFPHDLVLITGDPGERRRFLNLELGKTRPSHFADAARYRRVLQQRNALLKYFLDRRGPKNSAQSTLGEPNAGLGTLSEWNRQMVTYGARILEQRAQFLQELAPILADVHHGLSGIDDKVLSLEYIAGVKRTSDETQWSRAFHAALEGDYDTDLRRGNTQSGPHRDDMVFWLGDMDLRRFGSQGQQRLAVLSLKIALARWVRETTGESPILLLDDALSELDGTRRALVLQHAATFQQSILTATDETFIHGATAHVFQIVSGRVRDADYADIK